MNSKTRSYWRFFGKCYGKMLSGAGNIAIAVGSAIPVLGLVFSAGIMVYAAVVPFFPMLLVTAIIYKIRDIAPAERAQKKELRRMRRKAVCVCFPWLYAFLMMQLAFVVFHLIFAMYSAIRYGHYVDPFLSCIDAYTVSSIHNFSDFLKLLLQGIALPTITLFTPLLLNANVLQTDGSWFIKNSTSFLLRTHLQYTTLLVLLLWTWSRFIFRAKTIEGQKNTARKKMAYVLLCSWNLLGLLNTIRGAYLAPLFSVYPISVAIKEMHGNSPIILFAAIFLYILFPVLIGIWVFRRAEKHKKEVADYFGSTDETTAPAESAAKATPTLPTTDVPAANSFGEEFTKIGAFSGEDTAKDSKYEL